MFLSKKTSIPPRAGKADKISRTINAKRLKLGGKILLIPFKAGPGVEATSELDEIALRVNKGMADTFKNNPHGDIFKVLDPQSKEQSDLKIKGFFTQYSTSSKKFLLGKDRTVMSIEVHMLDTKTGEHILFFTDRKESTMRSNQMVLGELLGEQIAEFILSGVK